MLSELGAIAGYLPPPSDVDHIVIVPYKPKTAEEARKFLKMLTMLVDFTDAGSPDPKWYAGFSDDDLLDGKPGVKVSRKGGPEA
jgi:hypothetical protein